MRKIKKAKIIWCIVLFFILILFSIWWSKKVTSIDEEKLGNVEYEIVEYHYLDESVRKAFDAAKSINKRLTFEDENYQYLIVCYGKQEMGGYSVEVKELYETNNMIVVDTTLKGPQKNKKYDADVSYPGIVIRINKHSKLVVFK